MRKVWGNKNLLDFFHVCPLLVHQKMGDGGNRPVYKFVFACPGRAAAMVSSRRGGLSRAPAYTTLCVLNAFCLCVCSILKFMCFGRCGRVALVCVCFFFLSRACFGVALRPGHILGLVFVSVLVLYFVRVLQH